MPLLRGRTATNRVPAGSGLNFYPVRNWHQAQHLVVIGRHSYRTIESYDWEPLEATALYLAAARGAMRLDRGKRLDLPALSNVTPDLDDEHAIIVSNQPIHEQMADSITLLVTAKTAPTPLLRPPTPYLRLFNRNCRSSTMTTLQPPAPGSMTHPPMRTQTQTQTQTSRGPFPAQTQTPTPIRTQTQIPTLTPTRTPPINNPPLSTTTAQIAIATQTSSPPSPNQTQKGRSTSPHTSVWLAAEFKSMAKTRAALARKEERHRTETSSALNAIRKDLQHLTTNTSDALIRVIQESRELKTLLDTILSEIRKPTTPTPSSNSSPPFSSPTSSTHSDSTQAVDIQPFA